MCHKLGELPISCTTALRGQSSPEAPATGDFLHLLYVVITLALFRWLVVSINREMALMSCELFRGFINFFSRWP